MIFNVFGQKRIFISFDYDNDKHYRYLLSAWAKNSNFGIDFYDHTPSEIQSDDFGSIKRVLSRKIGEASHTLVIIGKHANAYHPRRAKIGDQNWQWWEIRKSLELRRGIIAVKLNQSNPTPDLLYNKGTTWAYSFTEPAIKKAIENA